MWHGTFDENRWFVGAPSARAGATAVGTSALATFAILATLALRRRTRARQV